MSATKKAKAKKPAPKRAQTDPNRATNGWFKKGHTAPGPGRPPIPERFKGRGTEALEYMFGVATGEIKCEDEELRYRAAHDVVLLVYSKKARFEGDMPGSHEERVKAMEAVVYSQAEGGDVAAALKMLEALEPTKWGKKTDDGGNDDTVDSLEFVPMVRGEGEVPPTTK